MYIIKKNNQTKYAINIKYYTSELLTYMNFGKNIQIIQ